MILLNNENIDRYYREYLRQYKTTQDYISSRGGRMRDMTPLNRERFKVDFISELEDKPKTAAIRIAQNMAKDELFIHSYAQGLRFARAHVKIYGGKVDINLIQMYRMETWREYTYTDKKGRKITRPQRPTIWDDIATRRAELKEEGYNTYISNMYIGEEFFGSK